MQQGDPFYRKRGLWFTLSSGQNSDLLIQYKNTMNIGAEKQQLKGNGEQNGCHSGNQKPRQCAAIF